MAYFILLAGIVLLLLNYRSWNTLRHAIIPRHTTSTVFPPLRYLQARWLEWQSYALGNRTLKESKGALAAIAVLCALLFLNANWLQFRLWLFIPMILPLLFMAQISIGRTLERRYFENAFPEVLSVINASISAGNSIHQALHRCGESIEGPLGNSFRRIVRRLNLGEEPERVLNDACREYRYREFYFFVAVMLISLQHGGQLRMLIGRLNRIITNSRNMSRRKLAMTSEARASAKIVAAIPLLFFCGMKYLSPENFDFIINDPTGQLILYYVIASECIGMLIIWLLLRRAL